MNSENVVKENDRMYGTSMDALIARTVDALNCMYYEDVASICHIAEILLAKKGAKA